jgi:DNA-binding NtrC family response regulator
MKNTKRILLIEDVKDVAKSIETGLRASKKYNFESKWVPSPREYLEEASRNPLFETSFDLHIVDLAMPGGSRVKAGFRIIMKRSFENPGSPIWVYTGHAKLANAVWAMQLGATNFISKTEVAPMELVSQIENFFSQQESRLQRQTELHHLREQNWDVWKDQYVGQFVIVVGNAVVAHGKNRMEAWLEYDKLISDNPNSNWPDEPDMLQIEGQK